LLLVHEVLVDHTTARKPRSGREISRTTPNHPSLPQPQGGEAMLLIRDIMHCKPGKVRPLVEKFLALAKLGEEKGWGKMRVMTDVGGERYWTLVAEIEVPSLDAFMAMGQSGEDAEAFAEIMKGYHDLVDSGRREIYRLEE
jgi:hypothetical protein